MNHVIAGALGALGLIVATGVGAAGFQYYVAPLQGITGISQSALGQGQSAGGKYGGMVNAKYADIFFDAPAQKQLIDHFSRETVRAFPTSVIGANQITTAARSGKYAYEPYDAVQCSPNFRIGYRDAFAVAIGISRLSVYVNDYSGLTQALIPVTYTLRFVKLNGAAVLFSKSETIYTQVVKTTADFYEPGTREMSVANQREIGQAILADAGRVVSQLVDYAEKNFRPKQSQVNLVGRDGPYFIFDRGSEIGFSSGSEFDAQDEEGKDYSFVVKYATDRLAVAVAANFSKELTAATNRLREGTKLTFSFEAPGRDDAKLSVMAVQYQPTSGEVLPQDMILSNALQSVLVDDLGFSAPFNLIKQDPDFVRLKEQIRSEANCESTMFRSMPGFADNSTERRSDPDLFLKVDHVTSPVFQVAGVGGTTTNDIFTTAITLSLMDRSSVVRQTFVGSAQYELVRTAGKGLAVEQAVEVNLKNAGQAAVKQMVAGFAPRQRSIPVTAVEAGSLTLGSPISPSAFAQAKLVRPLRVAKMNKTVLLPLPRTGEDGVAIEPPTQPTQKLSFRGQAPKASDTFVIGASEDHNVLRPCGVDRNGRFLQHAALKHPSGADRLLPAIIGASMKSYDFVETSPAYLASAGLTLAQGFFQSDSLVQPAETPFCFLPLELQNLTRIECAGGRCNGNGSVASGVRIFNGTTKVGESVLGASFEVKEIPEPSLSQFVGLKAFEQQLRAVESHRTKLQ